MTRPRKAEFGLVTATINDVAARAGVSKRTVSRVMNEEPNITADTRERVMEVVQRLGYRPNPAARRLASGKSQVIGLFHSACTPPDPALVEQVVLELAPHRYRVLVCSSDCRTPGAAEESAALARVIPIDGAILCAPLSEQLAIGAAFHAQRIPCVQLGASGRHGVSADDREAARQVTRFLTSLGHVRIAFIGGPKDSDSSQQRRRGFLEGLEYAGLAADPALMLQGAGTFESGLECGRRWLSAAAPRATAIVADTDDMAAGVLVAAHESGVPVPDALSVIGFGDRPIARQVWPSLSSVRPPARSLATRAASLLLELLNGVGPEGDSSASLSAEIVMRNSTGVPRHRA
jgi:LacI family transcriptional regulator